MNQKFKLTKVALLLLSASVLSACSKAPENETTSNTTAPQYLESENRLNIYFPVELTSDLSHLTDNQKQMLALLIDASNIMDDLFWKQAFGEDKKSFLANINNPKVKEFAKINYGPWDRLNGDKPFLSGYKTKAHGAEFYPSDITKAEFEQQNFNNKNGLYSL